MRCFAYVFFDEDSDFFSAGLEAAFFGAMSTVCEGAQKRTFGEKLGMRKTIVGEPRFVAHTGSASAPSAPVALLADCRLPRN